MALLAARELGVTPESCLFVGDSNVDIRTGENADMFTVGVSWGFRGAAELVAAGAKAVINDPVELLGFVIDFRLS